MNRIYLTNFGKLPILAKQLWTIPKYTCNHNNENLIEESCNYFQNNKNNYLDIEYLLKHWEPENNKLILKDKLELSFNLKNNSILSGDFHSALLPRTQEILTDLKKVIEENRDKFKIVL